MANMAPGCEVFALGRTGVDALFQSRLRRALSKRLRTFDPVHPGYGGCYRNPPPGACRHKPPQIAPSHHLRPADPTYDAARCITGQPRRATHDARMP